MALYKWHWRHILLYAGLGLGMDAAALDNYRATYDLNIRGIDAGKVTHEAIFTAQTYRIDTFAQPATAAKLLGYGDIRESVTGLLQGKAVLPERYQRSMDGNEKFHLDYVFSASKRQIDAQIGSQQHTFPYPAGEQPFDTLSMVVQSLLDMENGTVRERYSLISEYTLRSYRVEREPDEKGADGQPLKVFRQVHENRETRIYIAEHPVRLIALTQAKDGKIRFSLKLVDYQKR